MTRAIKEDQPVYFAAVGGGHLELLCWIAPLIDHRRIWVTSPGPRAQALIESGEQVRFIRNWGRNVFGLFKNIRDVLPIILRERPRVVVASGAGGVVPLCVLARLIGSRVIFTETTARVTGPSMSGSVLARLASRTLVQWPEMASIYPRAIVCRPTVLSNVAGEPRLPGKGTLVAVGTHIEPFDRLLKMVDAAVEEGLLPHPVIAQAGSCTYKPRNYDVQSYMPPLEMAEAVANAQYVVCHGGSGLIASALEAGRRPLVLTRLERYGEHFDDHQLQLAGRLDELGFVVLLRDRIAPDDLEAANTPPSDRESFPELPTIDAVLRAELGISTSSVDDLGDLEAADAALAIPANLP